MTSSSGVMGPTEAGVASAVKEGDWVGDGVLMVLEASAVIMAA